MTISLGVIRVTGVALILTILGPSALADPAGQTGAGERSRISLDGVWKFCPPLEDLENNHSFLHPDFDLKTTPKDQYKDLRFGWTLPDFVDTGWLDLPVPSSWNVSIPDLWSYEGHGWYRRTITVPKDWEDRRVLFHSEGANYRAVVFVNGGEVGSHDGGYLPFSIPIQDRLVFGETNTIAVLVDNKALGDRCPMERHDWWNHGGLYRSVWLETTDRVYVEDATVTADLSANPVLVDVRTRIAAELETEMRFRVRAKLSDAAGQSVADALRVLSLEAGAAEVEFSLPVEDAHLWSPEDPYLYSLELTVLEDDSQEVRDSWSIRVGVRSLEIEGTQLLLNGEPFLVKGVNRYENYPDTGNTSTEASLLHDLKLIKEMGANAIRCHYPNSPRTYELCDELGILMVCEVPLYQWGRTEHSTRTLEAAKRQLAEMIHVHKNRPSIAFWSVSNENMNRARGGGDDVDERTAMVVTGNLELVQLARDLDPTRLVIEPSNCWPEDPVLRKTDFLSINTYIGPPIPHVEGLPGQAEVLGERLAQLRDEVPGKPILVTEFGAWCVRGMKTDYYPGEGYQAGLLRNYWETFLKEPGFCGGFVWVFADSDVHRKYVRIPEMRCAYGVFDLHRRPKEAVETMRRLWLETLPD